MNVQESPVSLQPEDRVRNRGQGRLQSLLAGLDRPLHQLPLGDVHPGADDLQGLPLLVPQEHELVVDPDPAAIRGPPPVLVGVASQLEQRGEALEDGRSVVRVDAAGPEARVVQEGARAEAEGRLHVVRDERRGEGLCSLAGVDRDRVHREDRPQPPGLLCLRLPGARELLALVREVDEQPTAGLVEEGTHQAERHAEEGPELEDLRREPVPRSNHRCQPSAEEAEEGGDPGTPRHDRGKHQGDDRDIGQHRIDLSTIQEHTRHQDVPDGEQRADRGTPFGSRPTPASADQGEQSQVASQEHEPPRQGGSDISAASEHIASMHRRPDEEHADDRPLGSSSDPQPQGGDLLGSNGLEELDGVLKRCLHDGVIPPAGRTSGSSSPTVVAPASTERM